MQTTRLLTLYAISLLIYSCSNNVTKTDNSTILSGQVVNRSEGDPAVITWNLCDPFNDDRMVIELSEDGRFHMVSEGVNLFHNMTIRYNDFINFFAAPGDSIYMEIDMDKMKAGLSDAVHFGGDRSKDNNESYNYYNYLSEIINSDYKNQLNMDIDPTAMISELNKRLDKYKESMAVYEKQQKSPMSDNLRDFMQRDMIFSLANRLLDYKRDSANIALELFSKPLFGINDSLNFCTMMFPFHLKAYMDTKVFSDTVIQKAAKISDYPRMVHKGIDILMNEATTINRDLMIWQFLSEMIEVYPELYDSIPGVQDIFTHSKLNDMFADLAEKYNKKIEFPETPIKGIGYLESDNSLTVLSEGDIFVYLTKKYPNKVLYIDVYATWCKPCRAERKYATILHNLMKGKDVVFVNLCLGSSTKNWKKTIAEFNLNENYWFDNDASNLFMESYDLRGYPAYILIGKDGKIANLPAERPSHLTQDSQQINKLL